MKRVFNIAWIYIILIYNIPIFACLGLISLWHWDIKYVSDFGVGLIGGLHDNFNK